MSYISQLTTAFPNCTFQSEVALAPFTTVKIGGPAEVLYVADNVKHFVQVTQYCFQEHIPLTVLGWGANTLISDRGIRGLVIQNKCRVISKSEQSIPQQMKDVTDRRFIEVTKKASSFTDLDYQESTAGTVVLTVDSGAPLSWLIQATLQQGLTGLQWFSRIPATLGGAVVNNIHGGTHFLSEYVLSVDVITETGQIETWPADQLIFGYDTSIFHQTSAIISRVTLQLHRGDVKRAQDVVQRWAIQKKHQPQRSLGCIFQNLTAAEQQRLDLPTPSCGYFIDHVLHLKGFSINGAAISQQHAAFIASQPGTTAQDYLAVIKTVVQTAQREGVKLQLEIFLKGFTPTELSDIL